MKTRRLEFVEVSAEHATDYRRVMNEPEMGKHTDVPCQPTAKRATGFVNRMIRLNESGKGRAWALESKEEVIGFIRLNNIDRRNSTAQVGYEISKTYWGQGMATEAVRELVRYCHDELELHRLEAWVFNGNQASAKVLENAGFKREGVLRSKVIHRNERRDEWIFGRLITDGN
ncbi:GNAT family N-acetyltransferase [Hoeflea sp.]|uniref:GNAT family N-acetyltransferase n=1 Tax=Hoeflea sp. TaxID=1940281 RepID=UPI003747926A